jgi:cytochrome c553
MRIVVTIGFALTVFFCAATSADVVKGQSTYTAKGCLGCHGAGGKSVVPIYPSLIGKNGDFIKKNLTDFRSGARKNPVMNEMAKGLKDAEIANLADYINSLQ